MLGLLLLELLATAGKSNPAFVNVYKAPEMAGCSLSQLLP